jgi:hypothetical protein
VATDTPQTDTIRQIAQAWDQAKAQFQQLRVQVDRAEKMAKAKAEATFVGRERDHALRDLGEAVWVAIQKGQLQPPAGVARSLRAVQAAEDKQRQQAASIQDILQEGEEAAKRLKKPTAQGRNSSLAPRTKKR